MAFPTNPTEGQIYNKYVYSNGLWRTKYFDDVTVLADLTTRVYNGTITLSEPLTNFKQIAVKAQYHADTKDVQFKYFLTDHISIGDVLSFWDIDTSIATGKYANWIYASDTTFTFYNEYNSWIRGIYGINRK